ncbi:acyl transferase/acyl hydrolase/lysophospholipase [Endogone sp. FLAS-F59071]|nr:acyl transferase/acyl hydrolase/lysophospholipase [Endogone sp. FLAS-F59071]|eukprot:RUS18843.1 acyl transferase/acyl hydrolase/lysophospholipase [Endogone sp. FLAS-F59071]
MEEVVSQLGYIAGTDSKLNPQVKLDFFNDTRQSFGCSALVLYGGATFGLYHIGVVKALNQHGLLPRIISGTGVGGLIAALICIHTDDELPVGISKLIDIRFVISLDSYCIYESVKIGIQPQAEGINLKAFTKKGTKGNTRRKITRFLKHGYLMDIKVLEECVQANVGDLTFEEAYAKTKRILNISVSSTRKFEVPQLLNYLTAPNVLIRSAACASTASMGLYDTVNLLAKDKNGKIVQWNPTTVKWTDASPAESESPLTRLAELFNVNHFIVSQANPYIVPFVPKSIRSPGEGVFVKMAHIITSEFRHRLFQLEQMHLLPRMLRGMADENVSGNVTIVPDLSIILCANVA